MDGIDVYYTIQSKLFEQGLLDKEINQLILEFSLMNPTPNEDKLFLLDNDHSDMIIEKWLLWKESNQHVKKQDMEVTDLWDTFSSVLKLENTVDTQHAIYILILIEIRKYQLKFDKCKVEFLQEIEDFLVSDKKVSD